MGDYMASIKAFTKQKPMLTSVILWVLAAIFTLVCFTFQDQTGPTYPLDRIFQTAKGSVHYMAVRSENIGTSLKITLFNPLPAGVTGYVRFRRYMSNDEWSTTPFQPATYTISRRGSTETVTGLGAELPSLQERAGKYEYYVYIDDGAGEPVSVTGDKAIYARYKAEVPGPVLVLHILVIFASMALDARTVMETVIDGRYKWMLWATVISLLLGGFVLGPLVQYYAFGVWWSGIPYGFDWTDNKVLVELAFWILALILNIGGRRNRWSIYAAGIVTLIVYFIPHSVFGSEYNYRTGTGHGTAD
jgi:hypothetical protein